MGARDAAEMICRFRYVRYRVLDGNQAAMYSFVPKPVIDAFIEHIGLMVQLTATANEAFVGAEHVIQSELGSIYEIEK
ncbi:hypothetical protein [Pandoraea capi]|uniref:hypothetical protein n=1 Tax=Pandoraea TaxID=93217 RepID=UPI001F5E32ED|nr:hypothetical protein [Pandoraea capi]